MKYLRRIIIVSLMLQLFILTVAAEEKTDIYSIIDYDDSNLTTLFSSDNYLEANDFYSKNINKYNNLCMLKNDDVILMEYGTIYTNDSDEDITYYSDVKEENRILGNSNEYELLYLNEINDGVEFAVGGDIGHINFDGVTYFPYNSHSISYYESKDGKLLHHIASSINNYYKYNLAIDIAPEYLEESKRYYSFDEHYFYDDFYIMSDDLSLSSHEHAINKNNPYYNYYSYLPSRSYTNYTLSDFNLLIKDTLGINGRLTSYVDFDKDNANDIVNLSEYYGNMNAFVSGEKMFGVNALLSLAWSSEESSFGKSLNSYTHRNVFNHSAYAGTEIDNSKYSNVKSSIFSHMENYVSKKYCDMFSSEYVGSHIGGFTSGIASVYSYDPYFSEKIASKAYFYDSELGFKDRNQYTIGICKNNITLFYDKDLSTSLAGLRGIKDYSLIILDEYDDVYKVQCDYAMNQTGKYNPMECVVYVKKKGINKINEDNFNEIKYNEYIIDNSSILSEDIHLFSKGEFDVENDFIYKEPNGCEIVNYHLEENKYVPTIKKITEVIPSGFKYPSLNNYGCVIGDGRLQIKYEDGTEKIQRVTMDDILHFNNANSISQVDISYKGVQASVKLDRDYKLIDNSELNQLLVDSNNKYSTFSFNDVDRFDLDFDIAQRPDISTFIRDNDYNFSISGLYPSIIYNSNDYISSIVNTYYFDIVSRFKSETLDSVLHNYGLQYFDSFNVSIKRNFYEIDLISPVIMQVTIPHANDNFVYSVFHIDSNNNIVKCPTQFSDNNIRFMTLEDGDFYIYSVPSASKYSSQDTELRTGYINNGVDYYSAIIEGIEFAIVDAIGFVMFVLYFVMQRKENRTWRGFKKSLQQAEFVQEETQNN